MDATGAAAAINLPAIFVSAVVGFAIGGLWYGPLFSKAWIAASGVDLAKAQAASKSRLFGAVFLLNLVAAFSLAMFIGPQGTLQFGLFAGFMTGATFISTALGVIYLFEMRPLKLWLINAGYQTINFTAMGAVLGAWR